MNPTDADIRRSCRFALSRAAPATATDTLKRLAASRHASEAIDVYGDNGAVARLQDAASRRLGKQAGLFFIKGVIAQLCVLQVHAQARRCRNVVIHPLSHLDVDEQGAAERVASLNLIRLGRQRHFDARMLDALTEPLAAVVVELPLRRAGFLLPPIERLRAISAWCRARGVPLHFDGARIWESSAGYGMDVAELAELADSVYVSWYKGLGGLGGALVAGHTDFIDALRVWKTRYGGDLFTAYPYAIAALEGLDTLLPRLPEFVQRARTLAAGLAGIARLHVHPSPPHTNAFQVWLPGTPDILAAHHRAFATGHGVWLFDAFSEAPLSGHALAEIQIGADSDAYDVDEAVEAVRRFVSSLPVRESD